jgi:hypothetical protein
MREFNDTVAYVKFRSLAEVWEFLFGALMRWFDGAR